jgi:alkaline phosphatase
MKLKFGAALLFTTMVSSTLGQTSFPIKRAENRETWNRDGWAAIDKAKGEKIRKGKAKNVILFIGDGMGVSTLTAARIFEGQRRGESG